MAVGWGRPWSIGALGVGFRLLLLLMVPGGSSPEVFEYEALAVSLLAGEGWRYVHLGTPYLSFHSTFPYVVLNAALCWLTDHRHVVVLVAQSLLSVVLARAAYGIGDVIFGPRAATVAAGLTAVHPGLLYYDVRKLHPLGLDALLIAAGVWAYLSLRPESSRTARLGTGALVGLALLERGSLILFAVVATMLVSWAHRGRVWSAVKYGLPIAAGVAVLLGPWLVRNYVVHGVPMVMSTSGEHFWRGNHPGATGTSLTRDGRPVLETADATFRARIRGLDELGQMRAFRDAGLAFWQETPGAAIGLYVRKLYYFFAFGPSAGALYAGWMVWLYAVYYALCVAGALTGAGRVGAGTPAERSGSWSLRLLPLLCLVSVAVVQSAFYVETRHRWSVEPLLLVLTAGGVVTVWTSTAGCRRSGAPA